MLHNGRFANGLNSTSHQISAVITQKDLLTQFEEASKFLFEHFPHEIRREKSSNDDVGLLYFSEGLGASQSGEPYDDGRCFLVMPSAKSLASHSKVTHGDAYYVFLTHGMEYIRRSSRESVHLQYVFDFPANKVISYYTNEARTETNPTKLEEYAGIVAKATFIRDIFIPEFIEILAKALDRADVAALRQEQAITESSTANTGRFQDLVNKKVTELAAQARQ